MLYEKVEKNKLCTILDLKIMTEVV